MERSVAIPKNIWYTVFIKGRKAGLKSMHNLQLTDMAGAYIEHSMVITNFTNMVGNQLKNSMCRVFPDNVQYTWWFEDEKKTVIPDASINCQVRSRRGNAFVNAPQFVMEVLSDSTERYDRTEKKDIYRKEEINEYWIVNWQKKEVEIYNLDYDENQEPQYYLFRKITEENKDELNLSPGQNNSKNLKKARVYRISRHFLKWYPDGKNKQKMERLATH